MADQLARKADKISKEDLNEYLLKIKVENKDINYYSRINAIGIYTLISMLPYHKKESKIENLKKI